MEGFEELLSVMHGYFEMLSKPPVSEWRLMGKCDVSQKIFWEDNARFADLFNVALGKGEQILSPENLSKEESNVLEVVKKGKHKILASRHRDMIKKVSKDLACYLVGIENQSRMDYSMPLRIMFWDALSYQEQIRELERMHKIGHELEPGAEFLSGIKKDDRLKPVCTIVLYYGEEEWTGPRNLHDMLEWKGIPDNLKEWFTDYPMILVDVFRFPDWEKFQTDLREVFGFIQNSGNKEALKDFIEDNKEKFSSMAEDACEMIEMVTGTRKISQFRKEVKEGNQDMCKAIDDMLKEKWELGIEEGKRQCAVEVEKVRKEAEQLKEHARKEAEQLKEHARKEVDEQKQKNRKL